MTAVDKALIRISQLDDACDPLSHKEYFSRISAMPRANRIFQRIVSSADKEQLHDCLAEVRYALVFTGMGFNVEIEPLGTKGPDLKVSRDSESFFVEITRFRKIHSGPPQLDSDDEKAELKPYGDPARDTRKSFDKMIDKLSQITSGESIIAIWNDDEDLEEIEMREAVKLLVKDAEQGIRSLPNSLLFVLYASKWARSKFPKQIHCFPVQTSYSTSRTKLREEFGNAIVRSLLLRAIENVSGAG